MELLKSWFNKITDDNSEQPPPYDDIKTNHTELQEKDKAVVTINKQILQSKTMNAFDKLKNQIITDICEIIKKTISDNQIIRFSIVIVAEYSIKSEYVIEQILFNLSIRNGIYKKFNLGMVLFVVVKDDNMIKQVNTSLMENDFFKPFCCLDPRKAMNSLNNLYDKYHIDIDRYPAESIRYMFNYNLIKDEQFFEFYKKSCEKLVNNNFLKDLETKLIESADKGHSIFVHECKNPDMIYEYLTFHKIFDVSMELDTGKIIFSW